MERLGKASLAVLAGIPRQGKTMRGEERAGTITGTELPKTGKESGSCKDPTHQIPKSIVITLSTFPPIV